MRFLRTRSRSLCALYAPPPIVPAVPEGTRMDIAYLVLLAVLVGLTAGYIRLCAKLEERK